MFEEQRLRGEGADATGTEEFREGDKQVNREDQKVAHDRTLPWLPPDARLPGTGGSRHTTNSHATGGELPEFDSIDAANELLNALVAGLWNRLTAHQSSRNPFRLLRFDVVQTREGFAHFSLVRRQELDGFIEGLFGREEQIDLPERAHEALGVLAETRAMLTGVVDLLNDSSKPAKPEDLKALVRNIQGLTLILETEMNKTILSCKRARINLLEQMPAIKPTLH